MARISFRWISVAALFAVLTFNCGMAVYHAKGDDTIVAVVATAYIELPVLCCSLWFHERAAPVSRCKNRLKALVWVLTLLLTLTFGQMVMGSAGLTLPLTLLVWSIAAATGIGGYFTFFQHGSFNQMPEAAAMMLPI